MSTFIIQFDIFWVCFYINRVRRQNIHFLCMYVIHTYGHSSNMFFAPFAFVSSWQFFIVSHSCSSSTRLEKDLNCKNEYRAKYICWFHMLVIKILFTFPSKYLWFYCLMLLTKYRTINANDKNVRIFRKKFFIISHYT